MCGVSVVCMCEVCEECVYIHIYTCCVYICGMFLMLCIHMVYDCVCVWYGMCGMYDIVYIHNVYVYDIYLQCYICDVFNLMCIMCSNV